MLITERSLALHETVQQMGYNSLEDFALEQAREKLLQEINICIKNIEQFEKKYGIDYANFAKTSTSYNNRFLRRKKTALNGMLN